MNLLENFEEQRITDSKALKIEGGNSYRRTMRWAYNHGRRVCMASRNKRPRFAKSLINQFNGSQRTRRKSWKAPALGNYVAGVQSLGCKL